MKTIIIILAALSISVSITAQVPQKMSYQAIIRDAQDNLVRNQQVSLRVSILQDSINGMAVYKEEHLPMPVTNANGLITVEIGTGYRLTGTFSGIDWSDGPYYIKTEVDPEGSNNYSIVTTSELLSVPYALHAKTAETIIGDVVTNTYMDDLLARIEEVEKHLNLAFTDERDGTHYRVVSIGEQIWMAENLKYLPSVTGNNVWSVTEPYYYVNGYNGTDVNKAKGTDNYITYGVLYNRAAAMQGESPVTSNPSGVQGVCPSGWHLPSSAEWKQLVDYLGGDSIAGGKLKESGALYWESPNTGATNESGFTALPGGGFMFYEGFTFWPPGNYGLWWSASWNDENSDQNLFILNKEQTRVDNWGNWWNNTSDFRGHGLSVRCVKD